LPEVDGLQFPTLRLLPISDLLRPMPDSEQHAAVPAGDDDPAGDDRPSPASPENLVLTGFMGTGKTTVGRLLAERLNREFVDTDSLIVSRFGEIAEIFVHGGEARFREIERIVADDLAHRRNLVISTGGGMLLDSQVAALFASSGRIFCLCAEPDTICERVLGDPAGHLRPLLAGDDPEGRVRQLMAERAERYAAFEQVHTDDLGVDAIAVKILARFRSASA